MKRLLLSAAFLSTIPAANWMIGHVGTVCPPDTPCLVPVWPWPAIYAPSGSGAMGVALVLRNLLQQTASRTWILGCILIGALLSATVAPAALTIASATSFFFSEMADWTTYTPIRRRSLILAVLIAGTVGAVVDSCIFVTLAFGADVSLIGGQAIAKVWASIIAACMILITGRMNLIR